MWPLEPIVGILLSSDRPEEDAAGTAAVGFGVEGLLEVPELDLDMAELPVSLGNSFDGKEGLEAAVSRFSSFAEVVLGTRDLPSLLSLTSPSSTSPVADERMGWNSGAVGRRLAVGAGAAGFGSSFDSPVFRNISFDSLHEVEVYSHCQV